MYDTWYKTKTSESDVNQQIDAAALLGEHSNGRQDECQDDFANVTAGEWHFEEILWLWWWLGKGEAYTDVRATILLKW